MENIKTKIPGFYLRFAEKGDAQLIVKYIRDLAAFEDELEEVTCTVEVLERDMFDQVGAEALIGEFNSVPVGFALFHPTFSTFLGRKGMGLVDLYIEPEMRGKGFGKTMLSYLAQLAVERDCGRLEWPCHDWNDPAIKLYKKWGAFPISNLRTYRLCDEGLSKFSKEWRK